MGDYTRSQVLKICYSYHSSRNKKRTEHNRSYAPASFASELQNDEYIFEDVTHTDEQKLGVRFNKIPYPASDAANCGEGKRIAAGENRLTVVPPFNLTT